MPEFSFATASLSISRQADQADSTEAIQTVTFDYTKFPGYDATHFPIAYSVVANGAGGPTVSIDASVTPNVIAITGMASIAVGNYDYRIIARHKDQTTADIEYTLEIQVSAVDPCISAIVTVPAQTDPNDHQYSGTTDFWASYSASDPSCSIVYACIPPVDGSLDLCSAGTLNTSTGEFQLSTTDMTAYPPGTYSLEIQGYIQGY